MLDDSDLGGASAHDSMIASQMHQDEGEEKGQIPQLKTFLAELDKVFSPQQGAVISLLGGGIETYINPIAQMNPSIGNTLDTSNTVQYGLNFGVGNIISSVPIEGEMDSSGEGGASAEAGEKTVPEGEDLGQAGPDVAQDYHTDGEGASEIPINEEYPEMARSLSSASDGLGGASEMEMDHTPTPSQSHGHDAGQSGGMEI